VGFLALRFRTTHGRRLLLAAAAAVTLTWLGAAATLYTQATRERARTASLVEADRALHEVDAAAWRTMLGMLSGKALRRESLEHWSVMESLARDADALALAGEIRAAGSRLERATAATDGTAQGMAASAGRQAAGELDALNKQLDSAVDRSRARADRGARQACVLTVGGGGFTVVLVAILLAAYMRAARTARRLRTESARAEGERHALADSERRFRALVRHASDAVLVVGGDGLIAFATDSLERMLGRDAPSLIGRPVGELAAAAARERLETLIADAATAEPPPWVELELSDTAGRVVDAEARIADRRDDPEVGGVIVTLRDAGERRRLERQIRESEFIDAGTGLANRARFERWVEAALTAGGDEPAIAVLIFDLNDFQAINESLGYEAGDRCLAACAQRLRGALDADAPLARLAADEFALLLEGVDERDAELCARRLLDALAPPVRLESTEIPLTASVGVALAAAGGDAARPGARRGLLARDARPAAASPGAARRARPRRRGRRADDRLSADRRRRDPGDHGRRGAAALGAGRRAGVTCGLHSGRRGFWPDRPDRRTRARARLCRCHDPEGRAVPDGQRLGRPAAHAGLRGRRARRARAHRAELGPARARADGVGGAR
jgi:diguanylate cyclase (GGDEF)-like protein/PAS domain S-box-containing protein